MRAIHSLEVVLSLGFVELVLISSLYSFPPSLRQLQSQPCSPCLSFSGMEKRKEGRKEGSKRSEWRGASEPYPCSWWGVWRCDCFLWLVVMITLIFIFREENLLKKTSLHDDFAPLACTYFICMASNFCPILRLYFLARHQRCSKSTFLPVNRMTPASHFRETQQEHFQRTTITLKAPPHTKKDEGKGCKGKSKTTIGQTYGSVMCKDEFARQRQESGVILEERQSGEDWAKPGSGRKKRDEKGWWWAGQRQTISLMGPFTSRLLDAVRLSAVDLRWSRIIGKAESARFFALTRSGGQELVTSRVFSSLLGTLNFHSIQLWTNNDTLLSRISTLSGSWH